MTVSTLPKEKRIKNFLEVSQGLNKKQAVDEAMRCPQPTHSDLLKGCPLGVDILGFIRLIREGDTTGALQKIKESNPFPSICGRVCSAPCEIEHMLNKENSYVAVRALERFAADHGEKKSSIKKTSKENREKVAVVGSGPAGLTAAYELARLDYAVTVLEALPFLGGVLYYGIPEFRLPKKVLDGEIARLISLGVLFKTNCILGQTVTLEELFREKYKAVVLAIGAGVPKQSGIRGENLPGVHFASEFLMRINLTGQASINSRPDFGAVGTVGVIGFTHDALDCARAAIRLGKQAVLIYDGTEDTIRAPKSEVEEAKEEGVRFEVLTKPVEILTNGQSGVKGIKCRKMDFADTDSSGKWKLIVVEGSDFIIEAGTVIIAAGYRPNSFLAKNLPALKLNKDETAWTRKESRMTSIEGVFATGGVLLGLNAMVRSMADAKAAVIEVDRFIKEKARK